MPAIDKSLGDITVSDLEELVSLKVQEGKEIEYKEYLDVSDDTTSHKESLVSEVISFANDRGGDLLVGIPDDDGKPEKIAGFPIEKGVDHILEQWGNVIRRQTDPTLPTTAFDIEAIPIEDDRAVVIVRVERSWRGPHRVELNDRFYARSPSGKVRLDTGELRQRFVESERRIDQVREFRTERIARIRARETPVPLREGPVLALHVVPFSAFAYGEGIDVGKASVTHEGAPRLLNPRPGGASERHTVDGLATYRGDPTEKHGSYTLTFRTGAIEAVATDVFQPGSGQYDDPYVLSERVRQSLEAALPRFCRFLLRQEVRHPFVVSLTLIDAEDYKIGKRSTGATGFHSFDRAVAQLPEEVIERIDETLPDEPRTFGTEPGVRPDVGEYGGTIDALMNALWNAAGQSGESR